MPEGGQLEISTKLINIKKNTYVVMKVSDTGCGINVNNKNKIFDPFFTTKENGTGLGLASVYRIIESHKGTIKLESKWSKGTSITIQLPSGE
jgi:signal transduction histidine kinase